MKKIWPKQDFCIGGCFIYNRSFNELLYLGVPPKMLRGKNQGFSLHPFPIRKADFKYEPQAALFETSFIPKEN